MIVAMWHCENWQTIVVVVMVVLVDR